MEKSQKMTKAEENFLFLSQQDCSRNQGKNNHESKINQKILYSEYGFKSAEIGNLSGRTGYHKGSRASNAHTVIYPTLQEGNCPATTGIKRNADCGCHQDTPYFVTAK